MLSTWASRRPLALSRCASSQELVGLMETELASARMALRQIIDAGVSGHMAPETTNEVLIGRTVSGRAAIRTVEIAMEIAGGAGFFRDLGLELFRDVQGPRYHAVPAVLNSSTRDAWRSAWT
jgi:alkylation response protein AidB-like acyl-CoA dehydrogenase